MGMTGWLNFQGRDLAAFTIASVVGFVAGAVVPPGAWSVYISILVAYHLFLVWLLITADRKPGASLSPVATIVTHLAFLAIILPLGMARNAIPFFGIFRYSIAALAVFERSWLFGGKIEEAKVVEEVPISAVVATASGEDYAEWCRYLAQRKPFASKPGTDLKVEYERWLLARVRRRSAPASNARRTRGT
jgi:hypothetical protein